MNLASFPPLRQALHSGIRRFPLVLVAACIACATFIISNHSDSKTTQETCARIGFAMLFAFPLLIAAVYAGELSPLPRWIFQIPALLAVGLHWRFVEIENFSLTFLLVWIAAVSLASAVPGLVAHPKSNWWRVNIGALNALILSFILTMVVLIGLMLAIASLRSLFNLELKATTLDVMAVCGYLVAPLAVIMLLPPARADLDARQPGFAVWGRLCQWALVPIGFLFTGILAAYAVRILVERQLPDGMVALPVLVLGCYGLAAQWILEPWRNDRLWAKAFSRVFPVAFPLFSILLFLALARRIEDYGFTSDRYAALALAIWIVACCLVLLARRTAPQAFAPAMLAAFALIAAFGPLSSREVCLRSQTRHLEKLLANRSPENASRIDSSLSYLLYNYDRSVVEKFTGPLDLKKDSSKWDIANAAREKLSLPVRISHPQLKFDWPAERPLPVEGYRLSHGIRSGFVSLGKTSSGEKLEISHKGADLAAYAGSKKLHTFDLSSIQPDLAKSAATPPSFPWSFEGREFLIVILFALWDKTSESTRELTSAYVIVLEK